MSQKPHYPDYYAFTPVELLSTLGIMRLVLGLEPLTYKKIKTVNYSKCATSAKIVFSVKLMIFKAATNYR